ncbi:MAG: hypothetical protein LAN18_13200 [Acidobacteriia bacterium]|nr:hypothetical protein [Terriglobia bacterium]
MRGGVQEVVDFEQVDSVGAELLEGLVNLAEALFLSAGADLGGEEVGFTVAKVGHEIADDGLRLAI